jgi:small redox-active disulfide protein 2
MVIKILGSGCKNCKKLYQNAVLAADELGIEVEVLKVTDFQEIAKFNVMQTPALVVDEVVVAKGKVLTKEEIKAFL